MYEPQFIIMEMDSLLGILILGAMNSIKRAHVSLLEWNHLSNGHLINGGAVTLLSKHDTNLWDILFDM